MESEVLNSTKYNLNLYINLYKDPDWKLTDYRLSK
jgi:hypothetical protein